MSALARATESDCYARAANEDCVNGEPRTRTKYAYDANGNVTSRNGSIIGWTSYNYPDGVTTSTESATFDYGPNRQRWRMIYSGPSGNETTFYATPLYETLFRGGPSIHHQYIYAGGRPVVEISTTNGVVTIQSLLVDHQGGISSVVTDSTGASLVSESFTAYGNRREASTWTGTPTSGELTTMNGVTREGYTFQTVLGSMGLNHMNGRIEDSVTGRFLSPDPRGTIQGNTQSWNRYSYVNNNPMSYTDPSGFCGQSSHPAVRAAASAIPCGGGGVSVGAGSVEGLSGISDDGFGNLENDAGTIASTSDGAYYASTGGQGGSGGSWMSVPPPQNPDQGATQSPNTPAQSPDSDDDPDLQPIVVTAQKIGVSTTITGPVFGSSSTSVNPPSIDPERAYDAITASDRAYAAGDLPETARQLDIYYQYCGCSVGSPFTGISFPAHQLPPGFLPPITPPPITMPSQ